VDRIVSAAHHDERRAVDRIASSAHHDERRAVYRQRQTMRSITSMIM
jgi:hypothetical protein